MLGSMDPSGRTPGPRYTPLFLRVVAVNALLLVVAVAGTLFVIAPERLSLSSIAAEETALVIAVLIAVAVLNVALLRHVFTPLERMAALARRFDPRYSGQRIPIDAQNSEVTDVARAFNEMLGRLEDERRATSRRVLDAQEGERLRVAQDLHDEVGQTLTSVVLQVARTAKRVPEQFRPELLEAQETARASLEEVRRIALQLRPEALDDLGLASALRVFGERLGDQSHVELDLRLSEPLPELAPEQELVIYRVAQEALTNVLRHAGASRALLSLGVRDGVVELRVADDGLGRRDAPEGGGIRGMRERAVLVGAELHVGGGPRGGTEVRLDVPLERIP
jgi:two-component system sensor histidine kinase UhpB